MDDYQQASSKDLLLVLGAVIVGVILVWMIASWGLNALDAPPVEYAPERPIPGIDT